MPIAFLLLEALKKTYSSTHQQMQQSLVQLQGQLQSTGSEIVSAKTQAQVASVKWNL